MCLCISGRFRREAWMSEKDLTPGVKKSAIDAGKIYRLLLLLVVAWAAREHFFGIATHPDYDIHSDDVLIIERLKRPPSAAAPTGGFALDQLEIPLRGDEPVANREYQAGIDHPSLERWLFHYLLSWSGRMPEELPREEWDYEKSMKWNIDRGIVAPPAARRFVRAVNALFMVLAAIFFYLAVMRSIAPAAGLIVALLFISHGSTFEVCWSLGQDPLLWMIMAAALLLWGCMGVSLKGALWMGIMSGLAASTKLNGAFLTIAFCAWLLCHRKWRSLLETRTSGRSGQYLAIKYINLSHLDASRYAG